MANETTTMTDEQREQRLKELYAEKKALLDEYGVFGGGPRVNNLHRQINIQLEALGVDPNS